MTNGFKIGNIVWLKTGSPAMLINKMVGSFVDLVWFSPEGYFSREEDVSVYALTNDPKKETSHV